MTTTADHDVRALEKQMTTFAKEAGLFAQSSDQALREFLRHLHQPGWTTPAEFALVSFVLDQMNQQMKTLQQTQNILLKSAGMIAGH